MKKDLVPFMEAARLRGWSGQRFNNYVNADLIPIAAIRDGKKMFDREKVLALTPIDHRKKGKAPRVKKERPKLKKEMSAEQLIAIRQRLRNGEKQKDIAEEIGMSACYLSAIMAEDARAR